MVGEVFFTQRNAKVFAKGQRMSDTESGVTTFFFGNEPQRHREHRDREEEDLQIKGVIDTDVV
jgi:hypothetical protein